MPDGAHPLQRSQEPAALAFLDRKPILNVFLTWLIETNSSRFTHSGMYVTTAGEAITGVAFFGRQIVLAADDESAIKAFASLAAARSAERMIVAERQAVEQYWEAVRSWHRQPRAVRKSQPVFAVDAPSLRRSDARDVTVRRAEARDWQAVADNSAAMIAHELEYDPRAGGTPFDASVRAMIDRGLWWIGEYRGEYCFFVNAGASSARTLQLQGIWTPPHLRGKGLARAALSQICAHLLLEVPTLGLYVNDFNTAAIALYEATGFSRVGEFATYLF